MPGSAANGSSPAGFGYLLRQFRRSLGVTQEELAELAGISPRGLRDLELGKVKRPRRTTIDGLAVALRLVPEARAQLLAAARLPLRSPPAAAPADDKNGKLAPAQLPANVADFTGRDAELRQLAKLLADADSQPTAAAIVAIVGTAGVGKTALAVRWAHKVADRSGDGQLYINLRGYATAPPVRPIEALSQLLRGLGADPQRVPVDLDEAAGMFRTLVFRRRLVVVLDNAASTQQVRPLLPGSPTCLVIVTSRDQLAGLVAIEGARTLTLNALTTPDALALVERIVGPDRVWAEPAASAEMTRLCGCLPLALRIASAKLARRPYHSIAAYIDDLTKMNRLAALEVDGDSEAAVRAAFDLSYRPLRPETRRLFRLLGLVPGPDITASAAAALLDTSPPEASRLLGQLVAAHLIDEHTVDRYRLHDLLRLYALQRAEAQDDADERTAAIERLLSWYLTATDAAAKLLYPHLLRLPPAPALPGVPVAEFGQAPEWLDAERANLLAAIALAASRGPRPAAWLLADALRGFFSLRRHSVDWLASASAGLSAAVAEADLRAQAGCQLSLAHAYWTLGNYPQSAEHYDLAIALGRQAGWQEGEATALGNLGLVHWELGRLDAAAAHLTSALAIDRQIGRLAGQANNLANLGYVYRAMGMLNEAASSCSQALAAYREIGARGGEANALANLGLVYHELGQPAEATERLNRALATYRDIGDQSNAADTLNSLAKVHLDRAEPDRAHELADAALALARQIGDRRTETDALNNIATIHDHRGQYQQALEFHTSALRLAGATSTCYQQVEALAGLATTNRHLGREHDFTALAELALDMAANAGYRLLEGQIRSMIRDGRQDQNPVSDQPADPRPAAR